jgi:hypothetical protein
MYYYTKFDTHIYRDKVSSCFISFRIQVLLFLFFLVSSTFICFPLFFVFLLTEIERGDFLDYSLSSFILHMDTHINKEIEK